MTLEQLQALIERLNDDGHSFRVKGIRISPDERFRFADQIEMDMDTYSMMSSRQNWTFFKTYKISLVM